MDLIQVLQVSYCEKFLNKDKRKFTRKLTTFIHPIYVAYVFTIKSLFTHHYFLLPHINSR